MSGASPLIVFFLLFLLLPLLEIYVLIEVGSAIGAFPTVALCLLTAGAGAFLLRLQGLSTIRRAQAAMARGEPPAMEMFEGVAIAIGGGLLLVPGFVTDFVGLLLLLPWTRRLLVRAHLRRARVIYRHQYHGPGTGPQGDTSRRPQSGRTIEGEYRRDD